MHETRQSSAGHLGGIRTKCLVLAGMTGFAGLADFNWWLSGSLLALNTFGLHVICAMFLPYSTSKVSSDMHAVGHLSKTYQTPFRHSDPDAPPQHPDPSLDGKGAETTTYCVPKAAPECPAQDHGQVVPGSTTHEDGQSTDDQNPQGSTASTTRDSVVRAASQRGSRVVKGDGAFPLGNGVTGLMPHEVSVQTDAVIGDSEKHYHKSECDKTTTCIEEKACAQESQPSSGKAMHIERAALVDSAFVSAPSPEMCVTPSQLPSRDSMCRARVDRGDLHTAESPGTSNGMRDDETHIRPGLHGGKHAPSDFPVDTLPKGCLQEPNPIPDTTAKGEHEGPGSLESETYVNRDMVANVMGFTRSLVGGAAMLSACLQRHHPHAATLFATKFVFEAGMCIAVDAGILLGNVLL